MTVAQSVLVLVVYVLAVARLTRLLNADTILDPLRLKIAVRMKSDNRSDAERDRWRVLLYWLECPWCVGLWLTLATTWIPLFYCDNVVVQYIGTALAASHLIGVFAFAADTEQIDVEDAD